MDNKNLFLHTPLGSKPFFKEEALERSKISKKLTGFFEKQDFFPIETPMIDYFDSYKDFFTGEHKKNCIRFIDQSGEVVLLRNDVTLFAAKMVASRSFDKDNILKYYYADSIVRNAKSGSLHEHYQIGCEMVGQLSECAEIEIVDTLIASLAEVGVKNYSLHIGDICVYRSILKDIIDINVQDDILSLVRDRDLDLLRTTLQKLNVNSDLIDDIITIASFIGDVASLNALKLKVVSKSVFENLIKIVNGVAKSDNVVIDMCELSDLDYYTGVIFHVYVPEIEIPIVSGGRYDKLFQKFGVTKQAVGFSYWLSPLKKAISSK